MSLQKPASLQDILKRRQQVEFVGREEQVSLFRQNLSLQIDDDQRRFIFNVFGQGGVGKTSLLRQFCRASEATGAITAWSDEAEESVPKALSRMVECLEQQDISFKTFNEQYRIYRQRLHELETDPEAPQGLSSFMGRILVKTGVRLGRRVPIGGALFDCVDEDTLANQISEWSTYVARKLTNKDEVQLMREPDDVLTPLFLAGLRKAAERYSIALFFDTYETTSEILDSWLKNFLEGRYGEVPSNIILAIAGREELDKNLWAPFEGLLARLPLEPFNEKETREYLARRGVIDERIIEIILHISGHLPLLVATLAAESPNDPDQLGDPSGTAVERFLKWEEDPRRRQVALDAALPRRLNRDVLSEVIEEQDSDALFAWLKQKPFIEQKTDRWAYHSVVRTQMLHYKHHESPQSWAKIHNQLAEYYAKLQHDLGLEERKKRRDLVWQDLSLETLYHQLCCSPQKQLPGTLNGFLAAFDISPAYAHRWTETIQQAGEDSETEEVLRWGKRLLEGTKAYIEEHYLVSTEMFTALLDSKIIEAKGYSLTIGLRGYLYYLADQYTQSISDLTQALQLDPQESKYWIYRGQAHFEMRHYDEALTDLTQALQLDPNDPQITIRRADVYLALGRYNEALEDYRRVLQLRPDDAHLITHRGQVYIQMGRYDEALADFNQALELEPNNGWAINNRGEVYAVLKNYNKALADFSRSLELQANNSWVIAARARVYNELGQYDEALADFNRALEFEPNYSWGIKYRGRLYQETGRYDEALADFDRALELEPTDEVAIVYRGELYRQMGRYDEALADFNRALELEPNDAYSFFERGKIYRSNNLLMDALKDFEQVTILEPISYGHSGQKEKGLTLEALQQNDEAAKAFIGGLKVDSTCIGCWQLLARVCKTLHSPHEIPYLLREISVPNVDTSKVLALRAQIYVNVGAYDEALSDLSSVINLDSGDAQIILQRGQVYKELRRYEEALADFSKAFELDRNVYGDWWNELGLLLSYLGRHNKALESYRKDLEEDPDSYSALYNIAVVMVREHGLSNAQADIETARSALQGIDNKAAKYYGLGGLKALEGDNDTALSYLLDV